MRLRARDGCYYISLVHTNEGRLYLARFCADPRPEHTCRSSEPDWSWTRHRGIGSSYDLEKVKYMCECDYARTQAASHISSPPG